MGNFDVGTTRYPRGKWGISNKNPTSGPPTVGFPRVVLSLTDIIMFRQKIQMIGFLAVQEVLKTFKTEIRVENIKKPIIQSIL